MPTPTTSAAAPAVADRCWRPRLPGPIELAAGLSAGLGGRSVAPLLSSPVTAAFAHALRGDAPPLPQATGDVGDDAGWFGPDSVSWRIHADHSMLVGGFTALALQSLHPRTLAGVVEHSSFAGDFMGRTRRTAEYVMTVTFGTEREAERVTAALPRIHSRVVGITPDGRPYDANDPELLDWVHVTLLVATAAAHRRFGAHPTTDAELDRYIDENARAGAAVGVVDPPRTWAAAMAALDRHRPNLAIGEQAADGLRYLAEPPFVPLPLRPLWRTLHGGAMACLPPFARRLIGGRRTTVADVVACRSIVRGLGTLLPPPAAARAARERVGR